MSSHCVISPHGCAFHKYADDTILSKSAKPEDFSSVQSDLKLWIEDVLAWMDSNKLKLNTSKTELLPVGVPSHISEWRGEMVDIAGCPVAFETSAKYLGVKIDQSLTMQNQISNICRCSFLELRWISSIHSFLSRDACEKFVNALITSRLDYCNSVLCGLPSEQIERLQRVQNNAARLILRKQKHDHVTPLLKELQWLPMKFRIQYKVATLAYHRFDGTLPSYLSGSLFIYQPSRSLRSSDEKLLKVPRRNLKSLGDCSFSFLAPTVWNSLPTPLRNKPSFSQFKSHLKTYYFSQAFPSSNV